MGGGREERPIDVSIVVICLNEEETIGRCLASLRAQDYREGEWEIVVVDGGSVDRTLEIVGRYNDPNRPFRVVQELRPGAALARNTGVAAAVHPHVAFIDADCEAPPDWLSILAAHFVRLRRREPRLAAVGGRNIPPDEARGFLKALGIGLDSYVGSFNSVQGRQFGGVRPVDSLATLNVLYDVAALEAVGGFDETLASEAEDADLNYRLSLAGYRLYFIGASCVRHWMRPTPAAWLRNMFRYGKGRARLLKRHPGMWHPSFLLPPLFGGVLMAAIVAPSPFTRALIGAYFVLILAAALRVCLQQKEPGLLLPVLFVYLIQHTGYAAGEIYGLLNPQVR